MFPSWWPPTIALGLLSLTFYGAAPISRQLGSWTVICPHPTPRLVKLVEAGAKLAAVPSGTPSTPTESQSRHLHWPHLHLHHLLHRPHLHLHHRLHRPHLNVNPDVFQPPRQLSPCHHLPRNATTANLHSPGCISNTTRTKHWAFHSYNLPFNFSSSSSVFFTPLIFSTI